MPPEEIYTQQDQATSSAQKSPAFSSGANAADVLTTDRMIVRTGNIALVVDNVSVTIDRIAQIARDLQGYVVSSNAWKDNDKLVGSITIRVPSTQFDSTMRTLHGMAVDVTNENSTSQDVTEEYTDLDAKLRNLEASEQQLLKLLDKAEKVEDILAIQRALTNTRGQIEQTKGRMQYLERTSTTSLISVSLTESKIDVTLYASQTRVKERQGAIQFYAQISGGFPPYSYQWDFGDDSTSTEANPSHSYKTKGTFTVSLTATDDRGNTDTSTRTDYIVVLPGWSPGSVASSAANALGVFFRGLVNALIWLGIWSPVWIIIGGIAYGIYYWRRRPRGRVKLQ